MTRLGKAADSLLGVLKSKGLGYVLNGLALALLVALILGYRLGYIPQFFLVSLPFVLVMFATSLAAFMARQTNKSAFTFLLATATAVSIFSCAVSFYRIKAPTAGEIYLIQLEAEPQVFTHSLPGDVDLFRDGLDKTSLRSFSDLPRLASDYYERWRGRLRMQGFSEGEAKAASMMLFTSTLWAHGNEIYPQKTGCIPTNEDNNWQYQEPTFQVVKRARIGCCTDYAFTLSLILSKNGFENRYVRIPGHIFNEAKINGKWYVLDANTNVFMNSAWNDTVTAPEKVRIHIFPHPGSQSGKFHRPLLRAFQNYLVNLVLFGIPVAAEVEKGREPDPEYKETIDSLY